VTDADELQAIGEQVARLTDDRLGAALEAIASDDYQGPYPEVYLTEAADRLRDDRRGDPQSSILNPQSMSSIPIPVPAKGPAISQFEAQRWRQLSDELTGQAARIKGLRPTSAKEWQAIQQVEAAARDLFGAFGAAMLDLEERRPPLDPSAASEGPFAAPPSRGP
jgi:hypothetical protein